MEDLAGSGVDIEKLKDIATASYFPRTAPGREKNIGTALLELILRGQENLAPIAPFGKAVVQKTLAEAISPSNRKELVRIKR